MFCALAVHAAEADYAALNQTAKTHLINLINQPTAQPEGNEINSARYIYKTFNKLNQDWDIYQPAPGRASIISVLKGDGTGGAPLILLSHLDTARPASGWTRAPFKAVEENGLLYGLGSTDAKNYTAVYLTVFNWLKANNVPLKRDIIFLATADEEAGSGLGLKWLGASGFLDAYKGAFAVNEGGSILHFSQDKTIFFVEAATKMYMDIKVTAAAEGGHSATTENLAVQGITAALDELKYLDRPSALNPVTRKFFARIAPLQDDDAKTTIDMLLSSDARQFRSAADIMSEDPFFNTQLKDTCTPTILSSGEEEAGAVSASASAVLNCRLLPASNPDELVSKIKELYASNPAISVEVLERPELPFPAPSSTEDELFLSVERTARKLNENTVVVGGMIPASSDSEVLRRRSITVYGLGFTEDGDTDGEPAAHAPDEHIKISDLNYQLEFVMNLVADFAVK